MTAKQQIIACFNDASDNLSVEEAIHRLVLWQNLEKAIRESDVGDEMDHDEFVKQLTEEGAFDESSMDPKIAK